MCFLVSDLQIEYSLWAKDLLFVVNDGYTDGMHAWLNAYHGVEQSSRSLRRLAVGGTNIFAHIDVRYDSLEHTSGVIWTALCIDYPGHSFSHLGILYGQYHLFVRITVSF